MKSERRHTHRRTIMETFNFFVVVPKKGSYRLPVHDLSEDDIGFDLDIEGETPNHFSIEIDEVIDLHLYLNQSLYLPLKIKVARIKEKNQVRRIGATFCEEASAARKACVGMLQVIDQLMNIAKITSGT